MLVSDGHAAPRAVQIPVTCIAIQCHGDIQTSVAAEGRVWVRDTTAARVCADSEAPATMEGQGQKGELCDTLLPVPP